MKRLARVYGLALTAALTLGAASAQAAEVSNVNSLSSDTGGYSFGYVSNGDKALGPFMVDTVSGRMWLFKRMEKKNWRLVPVSYVGDDGSFDGYLPGHEAPTVAEPEAETPAE